MAESMDGAADLLIEIGCEELPADSIMPMAWHLGDALHETLHEAGLVDERPTVFATPRRLCARWPGVRARQPDREVERQGPAVAAAFEGGEPDGAPTRALQGFLGKAGASVEDVAIVGEGKKAKVAVRVVEPGRSLGDVVAGAFDDVLRRMPMPRRMRWSDGTAEFLRPVAWLVALHGDEVLPLEAFGFAAGRATRGHRVHAPGPHELSGAGAYESTLRAACVEPDFFDRRARVVDGVLAEAERVGGTPVMEDPLIDEVTNLVEWPVALAGRFEERFLEIPKEALIQTMQDNQRYFALLDADGALRPAFVTVANLESTDPARVVDGNERVIRPRFADTMFFWEQDKRATLASRRDALDAVLFHPELGSVGDRVRRMVRIAAELAPGLGADAELAREAAGLAKCDLVSAIVGELPEMQGIAGRYYAARDGHDEAVARAVEQHWWPVQAGAALPEDALGTAVALADRLDALVGIFGIGKKPTGTKDPFALRRAAIGACRLLMEPRHATGLDEAIDAAARAYAEEGVELGALDVAEVRDFVLDRLRVHLVEQVGRPFDAVDAVLAIGSAAPADIDARVRAIETFRATPAAVSLSRASKRCSNLLRKADAGDVAASVDAARLVEPAEKALVEALDAARPDVDAALGAGDYERAMTRTAALAGPVDRFFDEVMVMDEDAALRANRLALLAALADLANRTADLSRLAPDEGGRGGRADEADGGDGGDDGESAAAEIRA